MSGNLLRQQLDTVPSQSNMAYPYLELTTAFTPCPGACWLLCACIMLCESGRGSWNFAVLPCVPCVNVCLGEAWTVCDTALGVKDMKEKKSLMQSPQPA